jgi:hypothetical protein
MAEEHVIEPGTLDIRCSERSMRDLSLFLRRQGINFGAMKEPDIDSLAVGSGEAFEESVRIRWRAVSCAPQGQPIFQVDRFQPVTRKDVDVRAPRNLSIKTLGAVPIMVAGSEEDRDRVNSLKRRTEKLGRVRGKPLMLVEIASAEDGIYFLLCREPRDP